MPAKYSIEEWARIALVANKDAASPTDETLEPFIDSVLPRLISANPCIGDEPLTDLTTDADLDAFSEWAGREVAAEYVQTPAGMALVGATGGSVKEKQGRVERTTTQPSATVKAADYLKAANRARVRVSCIREAIAQANQRGESDVVGVVGRRRTIGTSSTIEGGLLGSGRCGRV